MDQRIEQTLLEKKDLLPLLFRLYSLGRFARFFTKTGVNAIITEISAHMADNSSFANLSSQLSLELKAEQLKTQRIVRLKEALFAARTIAGMEQIVSQLEKKLEKMIVEDLIPNNEED